jgi:glutathione S-transferase
LFDLGRPFPTDEQPGLSQSILTLQMHGGVNDFSPVPQASKAQLLVCAITTARGVSETSVIIEYLDAHHPGRVRFIPSDADLAIEVRRWDRVCDNYINTPTGKIVTDRLRPEGKRDKQGVEEGRRLIRSAYDVIELQFGQRQFIVGNSFSLADCAAAPALWYGVRNVPLDSGYPRIAGYLERLKQRPSFARAIKESEPLFHLYPGD